MKFLKLTLACSTIWFASCKPQTESREHMDLASKRMSDSILNLLDSGFTLPAKTLTGTGSPIASSASSFTPATPLK